MKSSTRLQPVLELARDSEQAAARALAEARARADEAAQKLRELETYRGEYAEGLRQKTATGLNAMQMKDYQAFLARLDAAIRQQQQVVAGLDGDAGRARQAWLQRRQRLGALDKLTDRHRRRERADSERREQAEGNEHALRHWRRSPD
ncbi:MAG: flagellar export protein FliJ [Thiohalobacterales bacterium]|nr:flagellar export protein FliJ [Thiohalobacterales bacterium]